MKIAEKQNSLLLKALHCQNSSRPPIWIMRQAGRYMPQYRTMRAKYDFLCLCHQPELAAEVTLLPIRTFGMDAAILFSDILVIAEALGRGLRFEEGIGPIIDRPIHSAKDLETLPKPMISEALGYVKQTIQLLLPQLSVPLIGFCGAPFTVASYLVEGRSSRDLKKTKQWMIREPHTFHQLLNHVCDCTVEYLKMQITAGVNAIQIFDSWAHVLDHSHFRAFSLFYLKRIVLALKDTGVPIILFCRGSSLFAPQLAEVAPAAISLDWNADITQVRRQIPSTIALQGNLDPDILYGDRNVISSAAKAILEGMKEEPGYIFNLGHGIHPDTPMESVHTLVDLVHSFSTS